MGWLGKMVGGTIGFAMGGPLGAIAGAAFGHAFDRNSAIEGAGGMPRLSANEQVNMTFFVAAFSMLAKLTRADGHVSKAEIVSVENFMANDLNLSPQSRNAAVDIFQSALNSSDSFQDYAVQFYGQFRFQPQILEFMIDILFRVSTSDRNLAEAEEALIRSAAGIFNFSDARYAGIRSRHVSDMGGYYAILGSSPDDPVDQIKSAYRKRVSEYHPDKIASKGLPEEFTKFANDKFREIQEAYEQVKADKGFT